MSITFLYNGHDSIQRRLYSTIYNLIEDYITVDRAKNYSPILKTEIPINSGIIIRGSFQTDDSSSNGRLSYVTVGRSVNSYDSTEGLGFAWKKGNAGAQDEPNVFLVNNSPDIVDDLYVSPNTIVLDQGESRFHIGVKKEILINTLYNFRLDIQVETYALNLWIWAANDPEPSFEDSTRTAYKGAFVPNATGSYFGISVAGTKGGEWYYDNITVDSMIGTHIATLFRLKASPTKFENGTFATLKFYGYGDDAGIPGLSLYALKDSTWEHIGGNTATNSTALTRSLVQKTFEDIADYRTAEEFVDILAITPTASGLNSTIGINYISLDNMYPSGIHQGGAADIYINDPLSIARGSITVSNTDGLVALSAANGFSFPIHSIESVMQDYTGEEMIPVADWTYECNNAGNAYSTKESLFLRIVPQYNFTRIRVDYRYYVKGAAVQSYLESPDNRIAGVDNLAKIYPPINVKINRLDYKGTAGETLVRKTLIDFINTNPVTITISDILRSLYLLPNIAYIDTATIDITLTEWDHLRSILREDEPLYTSFTRDNLRAFYCDMSLASGVAKL